jgi:hypothetical protein
VGEGNGLADIACGEVRFAVREDKAVKLFRDGAFAGAMSGGRAFSVLWTNFLRMVRR